MKLTFSDKSAAEIFELKCREEFSGKTPGTKFDRWSDVSPVLSGGSGTAAIAWEVYVDERVSRTVFEEIIGRQTAQAAAIDEQAAKITTLEKAAKI
ncbi:MAG: hypothetical protein HZA50_11575 [Planctomycetes bacterium]|nr:hypothetical protein [Planctomycetota bacterium]